MRVVYVSPHAHLGGAERVTMDLLSLHDRSVVDPAVIFLAEGPLADEARALGLSVDVLPAPRLRRLLAARAFRRALAARIRDLGADLVHGVMAWGHAYAGPAAWRAGVPAVWFQHDAPVRGRGLALLATLTPAARILANSEYTAALQRKLTPWPQRIQVVHPGVQLPEEPREVRRRRGRSALGIADDDFAVGIVARLQYWKGQHVLLRAFASLTHARPRCRLVVVGAPLFGLEPEYPGRLKDLAAELGVAPNVFFAGHRSDVGDCLAAMDVAVHASVRPEAFGLSLIEAMAAGSALVAADSGAVREIVTPGVDALLVPPGEHEMLATALLALYDDPERRASQTAAALEKVRARFDARDVTRRVEALYREVRGAR